MVLAAELPWGAVKLVASSVLDHSAPSGQFAAQSLLVEFMQSVERKLQQVGQHETLVGDRWLMSIADILSNWGILLGETVEQIAPAGRRLPLRQYSSRSKWRQ